MKRFILFSLFSITLMACSTFNSCKKDETNSQPVCDGSSCELPAPKPQDQKLSGTGWSMTVPVGWASETLSAEEAAHVEFVMSNKEKHAVILLVREAFPGTSDAFALTYLREIRDGNINVTSTKQVLLNGEKFVLVTANNNNNTIWTWLAVKNGFGYTFSCGGGSNEPWHAADCIAIASTIVLQ